MADNSSEHSKKLPKAAIWLSTASIVVIGIANTGQAFERFGDTISNLFRSQATIQSTWQGTWSDPDGNDLSFVMNVRIGSGDSATGQISWRLTAQADDGIHVVGQRGIEWVAGNYSRKNHVLLLVADSVSDSAFLVPDRYKFQVVRDGSEFIAMSLNADSTWEARAQGRVILAEEH